MSLVVSPENYNQNKAKFFEVDRALKKLAQETPLKSTFCDLKKIFLKDGKIDLDMYDEYERQQGDPVHLSKLGAKMVAQKLRKHICSLRNDIFIMQ